MSKAMIGFVAALMLVPIVTRVNSARAADLNVIVSGALTGAFRELIPQFEAASGHKVMLAWGPSSGTSKDAIPVRIQNHEPADVLIMVGPALDSLINQGKFSAASRVEVAESRIGVGVRNGAPRPNVSTTAALKHTLLEAKSIGYSEGASGVYISTKLLKILGIEDQISGKARKITGELVGEAIERGDVELGLQQVSELLAISGVDFVGPLPEDVQLASPISAAVASNAREPNAAKAFVDFLSSEKAAATLKKSGLDQVAKSKQR